MMNWLTSIGSKDSKKEGAGAEEDAAGREEEREGRPGEEKPASGLTTNSKTMASGEEGAADDALHVANDQKKEEELDEKPENGNAGDQANLSEANANPAGDLQIDNQLKDSVSVVSDGTIEEALERRDADIDKKTDYEEKVIAEQLGSRESLEVSASSGHNRDVERSDCRPIDTGEKTDMQEFDNKQLDSEDSERIIAKECEIQQSHEDNECVGNEGDESSIGEDMSRLLIQSADSASSVKSIDPRPAQSSVEGVQDEEEQGSEATSHIAAVHNEALEGKELVAEELIVEARKQVELRGEETTKDGNIGPVDSGELEGRMTNLQLDSVSRGQTTRTEEGQATATGSASGSLESTACMNSGVQKQDMSSADSKAPKLESLPNLNGEEVNADEESDQNSGTGHEVTEGSPPTNAERRRINRQHHMMKEIVRIQHDRDAFERHVQAATKGASQEPSQPEEVGDSEASQQPQAIGSSTAVQGNDKPIKQKNEGGDAQRKRPHGSRETAHDAGGGQAASSQGILEGPTRARFGRGNGGPARSDFSTAAPPLGGRMSRADGGSRRENWVPKGQRFEDRAKSGHPSQRDATRRGIDGRNITGPREGDGGGGGPIGGAVIASRQLPSKGKEKGAAYGSEVPPIESAKLETLSKGISQGQGVGQKENVAESLGFGLKITFDTTSSERKIELAAPSAGPSHGRMPGFTPPQATRFIPGAGGHARPSFSGRTYGGSGPSRMVMRNGPGTEQWEPSFDRRPENGAHVFEFGSSRQRADGNEFTRQDNVNAARPTFRGTHQPFRSEGSFHKPAFDENWQKGGHRDVKTAVQQPSGDYEVPHSVAAPSVQPPPPFKASSDSGPGSSIRLKSGLGEGQEGERSVGSGVFFGAAAPPNHSLSAPHRPHSQRAARSAAGGPGNSNFPAGLSSESPLPGSGSARPSASILGTPPTAATKRRTDEGLGTNRAPRGSAERRTDSETGEPSMEIGSKRHGSASVSAQDWRSSKEGEGRDFRVSGSSLQHEVTAVVGGSGNWFKDSPRNEGPFGAGSYQGGYGHRVGDASADGGFPITTKGAVQRQELKGREEQERDFKTKVFQQMGPHLPAEGPSPQAAGSGAGKGYQQRVSRTSFGNNGHSVVPGSANIGNVADGGFRAQSSSSIGLGGQGRTPYPRRGAATTGGRSGGRAQGVPHLHRESGVRPKDSKEELQHDGLPKEDGTLLSSSLQEIGSMNSSRRAPVGRTEGVEVSSKQEFSSSPKLTDSEFKNGPPSIGKEADDEARGADWADAPGDAVLLQAYRDAKPKRSKVELYVPRRGGAEAPV